MTKSSQCRVLFVCMGNICRSPAAEIIFRKLVEDAGLDEQFHIDSSGTIGYHAGNPPDARMSATLEARGYTITGRSRKLRRSDLAEFDHILVADNENLQDVLALAKKGEPTDHVQLLTDYCVEQAADYIPDPYYGGSKGFELVADIVEDACAELLRQTS